MFENSVGVYIFLYIFLVCYKNKNIIIEFFFENNMFIIFWNIYNSVFRKCLKKY